MALLALPLANMAAILYGPAWLAVYPTLLALALIGTLGGAAVAIGLFLWCDPRRARAIAQLCAAVIGGAFLLAMQVCGHAALGRSQRRRRLSRAIRTSRRCWSRPSLPPAAICSRWSA